MYQTEYIPSYVSGYIIAFRNMYGLNAEFLPDTVPEDQRKIFIESFKIQEAIGNVTHVHVQEVKDLEI